MAINEGGTIARVEVVNFMCHKYLKVDLGPKINFVIGHNGSGKSAILTAITLALGANASSTNRGRNIGSFIKEGMSVANITIHLTNGGHRPYKPELYPGIIVVERRLNKEGASPYKLKNASGKIVSYKKEELVAILDHFSILVNNPLTMLTQDMARKFLSDSTAEDKYKLFMHGTQLSQLKADFETVRESLDTAHITLERKKEGLPILQEKANEAQRRYEDLQQARDVTTQIDEFNNELVWSQIILKEKAAEKLKRDVLTAEKNLSDMKEQYEGQKSKIDDVVKKIEDVQNEWDIHKNVPDPDADEKKALLEQKVGMEIQNREFKDELTDINELIKTTKLAKERQEANLKIQTDKLEASTKVKRDEILEEIKGAKAKIEEKTEKGKELKIQFSDLENQIRTTKDSRGRLLNESKDIRTKIEDYRRQVNQLESQRGDSMKAYGSNMPQVLDAIRRETRWKKRKPVGPLGSTLKLLQPQYAETLEIFFKKTLNAFVVECFEDKHLLFSILKRARMEQTPIMVSGYDIFDYSSGEPDSKYMTVLRALKFEDEWVKRQLIISNKIEKTLLMEDRAEADNVMLQRPRNIQMCFTSSGHKVGGQSGMKTESLDSYRGPPRFQTDIDSQIRKYKDDIEELQQIYEENEANMRNITNRIAELERRQRACRNDENAIETGIRKLYRYIEDREDTLKEEDPVDLSLFEEEINECNEKVKNYVQQFKSISAQRSVVVEKLKEVVKKLRLIEQKEAGRDEVSQEYRTKVNKLHELKTKLTDKLEELNAQKLTAKSRYESRKTLLAEAENLVRTWIQECQEDYPDRVDTEREPHVIEMEIKRLQGIASRIEDQVGISVEEVEALTISTCFAWDEAKVVIKGMEKLLRSLRKMLEKRLLKWESFRGYMSLAAKQYFSYYLHLRGDEGTLRFNHVTKRLDIRVSTGDQYSKGSRQKDSRSLSGGEKSFSQISLLLSLWQSISSPIICLDEFDVFMDAVNRKQTMSMIMNAANDNSSQYILITPQDATGINPGKFVTVHKLADPDRRD
ncbi:RecF/RecN/SMC [Mucor mucedo]|uniref:RecF/RecN/SMC n=1 Tax=Mucor mucedo TaxID=29922 RepID=UPI0022210F90|nr:RecF/RecN/SMC [Mucor mucedo]KAI7896432.1 RecF/RecN/SMC [Mucor mucedo]